MSEIIQNQEKLEKVSGGNREETAELGEYLFQRFPEFFPEPDNITDSQIYECLLAKVPNFRLMQEPGDSRTNLYQFKGSMKLYTHAEFMQHLKKLF